MHKNLFGEGHEQPPAATSQAVLIPPLVIMDLYITQLYKLYVIKMKPFRRIHTIFHQLGLHSSETVRILNAPMP